MLYEGSEKVLLQLKGFRYIDNNLHINNLKKFLNFRKMLIWNRVFSEVKDWEGAVGWRLGETIGLGIEDFIKDALYEP